MTLFHENLTPKLIFTIGIPAGTPSVGEVWIFANTDLRFYSIDSFGVITPLGGGGASGGGGGGGGAGEDGAEGAPGPPGNPGPTGAAGAAGATGPPGIPSTNGVDGEDGDMGWPIPGPQGATGPTGSAGPGGAAGVQGARGADGDDGIEGLAGPPGPRGPAGSGLANVVEDLSPQLGAALDAQSFDLDNVGDVDCATINGQPVIDATITSDAEGRALRSAGTGLGYEDFQVSTYEVVGRLGSGGLVGVPFATAGLGANGRPGFDGIDGDDGPPGPPGNQGPTGATGSTGSAGAAGPQGVRGPDGEDGSEGVIGPPGANQTLVEFAVACSDLTTALTTGTNKGYFRAPRGFTVTDVRASVLTAPTGTGNLTVDVNLNGTTIISTKLTFDASEKTTVTGATPRVISTFTIPDDGEISCDIDAVSGTITGAGLVVTLLGTCP